ncbi:MAG TPA: hypothetical protein VM243_02780 [Phycisphaerae bacterium]|nr:hypothetical protein [Phycisphaerae bacterium]
MKPMRVYADTSVFGGCLDSEFAKESRRFFELVRSGQVVLLISEVVVEELAGAPPEVQEVLKSLPTGSLVPVELTPEILELREAYLAAGIISRKFADDATHVAAATAARADALVSWNFKHLVRIDRVRGYNQVNLQNGFGLLSIVSPQEVWVGDDER